MEEADRRRRGGRPVRRSGEVLGRRCVLRAASAMGRSMAWGGRQGGGPAWGGDREVTAETGDAGNGALSSARSNLDRG